MARACALLFLAAALATAGDNPYAPLLESRGVKPNREGIVVFLQRFIPTAETPAEIAALIDALHGPDAELREQAVRRLSRIPILARRAVRDASEGDDPEVRRLCKRIKLQHARSNYVETLHAALQTIRLQRIKGLTKIVLRALPHCVNLYLQRPAQRALAATARHADVPILKEALGSLYPVVRIGALEALAALLRRGAVPDLMPLLKDGNAQVRLAVAETLATFGMRECLEPLAELLDAGDPRVRHRSGAILRALTGHRHGFSAHAGEKDRRKSVGAWRKFVRESGSTIPLRLPLSLQREFLGRTLVCVINTKQLHEYDARGKLVFQSGKLQVPWGCEGLENGHRIAAVFSARIVIEYDNHGTEVWRSNKLPGQPMSVHRLDNGTTLVACSDSGKIVEISPSKRVVWSVTLPGRPIDARRLDNGRTLVALYQGRRVVEIDANGAIVWEIRGRGTPSTVQRLPDGNTLVAGLVQHDAVTEHDSSGRAVWKLAGLGTVYEAQRLPNGHTLVATVRGVAEYDRGQKVVWKVDCGPCRIRRY